MIKKEKMKNFADNLRFFRKAAGLTQRQLAQHLPLVHRCFDGGDEREGFLDFFAFFRVIPTILLYYNSCKMNAMQ